MKWRRLQQQLFKRVLFGVNHWRDGPRDVEDWKTVSYYISDGIGHKAKVKYVRQETPEEYHARKKNMVTLLFFGKLWTF